jgi:hypothetical protein
LARGTDLDQRALAYEFAREFRKLIPQAVQFLVELCRPNPLRASAFLRGFYFVGVRPVVDESAAVQPMEAVETGLPSVAGATAVLSGAAVAAELAKRSFSPASNRRKPQWFPRSTVLGSDSRGRHRAGFESGQASRRRSPRRRRGGRRPRVDSSDWHNGFVFSFPGLGRVASATARWPASRRGRRTSVDRVLASPRHTRLVLNNELDAEGLIGAPLSQRWFNAASEYQPAGRIFAAFDRLLLAQTRAALERRLSTLAQVKRLARSKTGYAASRRI